VSSNPAFYQMFRTAPEQTVGRLFFDLGTGQWNTAGLRRQLQAVLEQHQEIKSFVVEYTFPSIGLRRMMLDARHLPNANEHTGSVLVAIDAISGLPPDELSGTGAPHALGRARVMRQGKRPMDTIRARSVF